jgi:hypothetical protein
VKQILAEGGMAAAVDGPAVAEDYANLCSTANERLSACAECLGRGMVSEALRISESDPPLLDLCGELDFVGVTDWGNVCKQKRWPTAEAIDGKTIAALNEAYSSGQAMEPLLKGFRRAVHARNTRECLRLLRQIIQVDTTDEARRAELCAFEEKRLAEMGAEFADAKATDDAERLAALVVEMNGVWTRSPDANFREELLAAARSVYERQALVKGREVVQTVSAAYAALDYERLRNSVAQYRALLADGYLKPDDGMLTQVDEAADWLSEETRKRDDERVFGELLADLRNRIEHNEPQKLDEILNALSRFDRVVPDRLEERAHLLLAHHKVALERVRRLRILAASALMVVVGAGIAFAITDIRYRKARNDLRDALTSAATADDLVGFERYLSSAEKVHPRLLRDPEVLLLLGQKDALRARVEQKRASFESALSRLEAIRAEGFVHTEPSIVEALIAEARVNAVAGSAQGQLATLLGEWDAHVKDTRERRDEGLTKALAALNSDSDELAAYIGISTNSCKRRINQLLDDVAKLSSEAKLASPDVQAQYAALSNRLTRLGANADAKARQLHELSNAETLAQYLDAVSTYVRAFPDDACAKRLSLIVPLNGAYRSLMEPVASCSSNNPFWYRDFDSAAASDVRVEERWPGVKDRLLELERDARFTDIWQCETYLGETIFFEGKPQRVQASTGVQFEGLCFSPTSATLQPEFTVKTINANTIRSRTLMDHCEYVKSLVSMVRFASAPRARYELLDQMAVLYATNGISPLLKLRLMDELVGALIELVGMEELPGWSSLQADLKSVDTDLHWLCIRHRDSVIANKKAQEMLDRNFSSRLPSRRALCYWELRRKALNRGVQWLGSADVAGGRAVLHRGGDSSREVWVVRDVKGEGPRVLVAARRSSNGWTRVESFLPGEPIFGPLDGSSSHELWATVNKRYELVGAQLPQWPEAWPLNCRE